MLRMTDGMFRMRCGWLADGVAVVAVGVCAALAVVIVMTMLLVDFVVNQVCKHTCDDSYNK